MLELTSDVLILLSAAFAVPVGVFFVEIVAAVFLSKPCVSDRPVASAQPRGRAAILIPAHNEEKGLLSTIIDVQKRLRPNDRLVVVADNCTDKTAAIATAAGAEVTTRNDLTKIGKGYALDWGLKYLSSDPPDVVVMVDADCRVQPGSIDRLAAVAEETQRPVQALYLMSAREGSAINQQVATFAWRVKNWARPLGLRALGLPCQLMGTGMAFPWAVIRSVDLSSGAIVEDLKLGFDLAGIGFAPQFFPAAIVTSTFPLTAEGSNAQRQRWEHGHISLILTRFFPLLLQSMKKRDKFLLALALDLLVPPLSLLVATLALITAIAGVFGYFSNLFIPVWLMTANLVVVTLGVMLARSKFAHDILPTRTLGLIPFYILTKLGQYFGALCGRTVSRWVRADRG